MIQNNFTRAGVYKSKLFLVEEIMPEQPKKDITDNTNKESEERNVVLDKKHNSYEESGERNEVINKKDKVCKLMIANIGKELNLQMFSRLPFFCYLISLPSSRNFI